MAFQEANHAVVPTILSAAAITEAANFTSSEERAGGRTATARTGPPVAQAAISTAAPRRLGGLIVERATAASGGRGQRWTWTN
ncbi:hypothetical protein QTJ16_006335 [Diplocarpon rosae]|uniref:Uncharacterized protein n=1 Tax=Diplocarpon rosae TaxID=946125 RepID=A0AAD9SVD3_9HELO|nr:hypothetical protein QTJ16_006335 [Diplocarpon rosae]